VTGTPRPRCPRCGGAFVRVPEGAQCLACGHVRYGADFATGHDPLVRPSQTFALDESEPGRTTRTPRDRGAVRRTRGGPADGEDPA